MVRLRYYVPVDVIVDVDEKRVMRVVVLDEEVRLQSTILPDQERAIQIAETTDWPGWEFGY